MLQSYCIFASTLDLIYSIFIEVWLQISSAVKWADIIGIWALLACWKSLLSFNVEVGKVWKLIYQNIVEKRKDYLIKSSTHLMLLHFPKFGNFNWKGFQIVTFLKTPHFKACDRTAAACN